MRMLLTSNGGLESPAKEALLDLLGKPLSESRTVVLLDAMLPFPGDKTRMLEHVQRYRDLGWAECDILTLFSGPPSGVEARLRSADVIFCYGGTNHWLAHAWRTSGLAPVLRELLDEKVYLGMSAGSMIFSRLHAAAVVALDDQDEVDMLELDDVGPALPLFDWFFVAHLGAPFFPHATDQWAGEVAARLGGPAWFLDDGSALVVRDLRAEPEVVSNGHWLHFDAVGALVGSR
ncbi:MAG TPA: Type 1 glutamine amidotransferase-like domain-containing protein [Pseudolysinimonas sp.]|jgi:dipeptidase E